MKVIVIGPRGKMGKLITQVAAERDDMELVAGVAPAGRDYVGQDLGMVALIGRNLGVPVVDDLAAVIGGCDHRFFYQGECPEGIGSGSEAWQGIGMWYDRLQRRGICKI